MQVFLFQRFTSGILILTTVTITTLCPTVSGTWDKTLCLVGRQGPQEQLAKMTADWSRLVVNHIPQRGQLQEIIFPCSNVS